MAHELPMDDETDEVTRSETIKALVKLGLGVFAFLGLVALLSAYFREPIERFGKTFVDRFGAPGMALGAFLADGAHFPLPPQFYLLAGEAGGLARTPAVVSVLIGSILGGLLAFMIGRRLGHTRFIARRVHAPKALVQRLFDRHGYLGVAVAGMLPISFCILCALGGALKLPFRAYGVIALVRVPRLLLSYAVVALAWGHPGSASSFDAATPDRIVATPDRMRVHPCHADCDRVAKLSPRACSFIDDPLTPLPAWNS